MNENFTFVRFTSFAALLGFENEIEFYLKEETYCKIFTIAAEKTYDLIREEIITGFYFRCFQKIVLSNWYVEANPLKSLLKFFDLAHDIFYKLCLSKNEKYHQSLRLLMQLFSMSLEIVLKKNKEYLSNWKREKNFTDQPEFQELKSELDSMIELIPGIRLYIDEMLQLHLDDDDDDDTDKLSHDKKIEFDNNFAFNFKEHINADTLLFAKTKTSVEYVQILKGLSHNGQIICTKEDFQRLEKYIKFLVMKQDLPQPIEKIRLNLSNEFIRYFFYKLHKELYSGRRIERRFLFFLVDAIYGFEEYIPILYSDYHRSTLKIKFSEPPLNYQDDLEKIKKSFGK